MTEVSQEYLTSVVARVDAVDEFAKVLSRLVIPGQLTWAKVEADYRLLAINNSLRRQIESISASVVLARSDFGHLAVPYVRPALEDVMYLKFFGDLELQQSQKLFLALGSWDHLRSLLAQRAFIGDEEMHKLWYTPAFLDTAAASKIRARDALRELQKEHKWTGGETPSGAWIADRAGERNLYDYLFAATSRAVHFSAGEILRRGWGTPRGILVTDKPEFRGHLTAFALDQLVRLYMKTLALTSPLLTRAGVASADDDPHFDTQIRPVLERVFSFGRVPLVHAHEWNLTPQGPLRFQGGSRR